MEGFDLKLFSVESIKMIFSTLISSIIVYYSMKFMDGLIFDTSYTINVFFLLLTGGIIYFSLYMFLFWLLDIREIYLLSKLLLKAKEYQKRIIEFYTIYE